MWVLWDAGGLKVTGLAHPNCIKLSVLAMPVPVWGSDPIVGVGLIFLSCIPRQLTPSEEHMRAMGTNTSIWKPISLTTGFHHHHLNLKPTVGNQVSVRLLLAKILAFSAHQSQIRNTEAAPGGNRKVALILSWRIGEHSRFMPQKLCPPSPWEV